MSDQSLGTISALVRLKLDQLAADAASVKTLFSEMEQGATASVTKLANASAQSFAKVGQLAKQLGTDMTVAGAAIVGGLGVAVKSGEDWNQTLLHVSANTSMSKQETEEMRKSVESLAGMAAPLDRVAQGYFHVTNFGFKAAEATKVLAEATKYAVATGDDASKVAEVLAGTLHNFGMSAKDAGGAMNVLHTAAARSNATLGEFASAAGQAFAIGHNYGITMEEVSAAIETMTQHQFSAATAATYFENTIAHVAKALGPTQKALAKLADPQLIKDFTQEGLKARGFVGVLEDIQKAADKAHVPITTLIQDLLPGKLGGIGAGVLGKNLLEFKKNALELIEINKKGEAGIWQYDAANKSLTGQIQILKNNFTILSSEIEAALLPAINKILSSVHDLQQWFTNLTTPQKEMIVQTAAIAGVALLAGGALLSLIGSVTAFIASLTLAWPAIAATGGALAPFVPWIIGITAAVALLAVAWQRDWFHIQQVTATAASVIGGIVRTFLAGLRGDWNTAMFELGAILGRAFTWAQNICRDATTAMRNTIQNGLNQIQTIWRDAVMNMVIGFARGASDIIGTLRGMIFNMIATITGGIASIYNAALNMGEAFQRGFSQGSQPSSGNSVRESIRDRLRHGVSGHVEASAAPTFELPKFSPSGDRGGGGGGRGGGGSSAMDDLKERAQEAKRALNEVYESLYKLTHDDFANQRHDAMKEFLENRAKGVREDANVALLAAKQMKIQHDEEEAYYQRKIALQKRANEIAASILKPARDLAEQAAATTEAAMQYASVLNDQVLAAFQRIADGQSKKADSALSNLLGGGDLGEMSRKLGEFFSKTVQAAKQAREEIEAQQDAAEHAENQKIEGAIAKAYETAKQLNETWRQIGRHMASQLTSVFEGALTDLFEHGFKNFFSDILKGFVKMLEQMVAQLLARAAVFGILSILTGGHTGFLGSFGKFLGFDDASNDRKAEHWGFDFADMFGRGMKDFDSKRRPLSGSSQNSTIVHAPITLHATINHEMDIRTVADRLAWHMQTRGMGYQGNG